MALNSGDFSGFLPFIESGTLNSLLDTLPAGPPPPGVASNFKNPENRGPALLLIGGILEGLMLVFLGVRLYTKCYILKRFTWDDLTCALAALGAVMYYIDCCLCVTGGGRFGRHLWDITAGDIVKLASLIPAWFVNWFIGIVLLLAKLTFLILYHQIFKPMRWLRICIYGGAVIFTIFYGGITIALLVLTTPRRNETWLSAFLSPRYGTALELSTPMACVGLAFDLYLLVLPIVGVTQLQLSGKRKWGVAVVFLTGFAACLASTLSIYYRNILRENGGDVMWNIFPVILTALTEMCVGVICACMPALAAFVRQPPEVLKSAGSSLSRRLTKLSSSSVFSRVTPLLGSTQRSDGTQATSATAVSTTVSGAREQLAGFNKAMALSPRAPNVTMMSRDERDEEEGEEVQVEVEDEEEEIRAPRARISNPMEIDMERCKEIYRRYEMQGNNHRPELYVDLETGLMREGSNEDPSIAYGI